MCRTILLSTLCLTLAAPAAHALDFAVTTLVDDADLAPGDGVCASVATGTCTLRAAVQEANAWPGPDRVLLGPGTHLLDPTLPDDDAARVGDLDVLDDLEVLGAGVGVSVIDGGDALRLFQVRHAGSFHVEDLSLVDGSGAPASAGAIDSLAGAALTLTRVEVRSCLGGNGGALALVGGTLIATDSTLADNQAGAGGGVFALDADVTLLRSTVSGNQAQSLGGGVYIDSALLTVRDSTLAGNAAGTRGGAIYLWNQDGTAASTLDHATLAGNSGALAGGALASDAAAAGSLGFEASLLAENTPADCDVAVAAVSSTGFNVSEDASCGLAAGSDLVVASAGLEPLGFHGGPTHTRPPLAGSPAVDRSGSPCTASDQRGVPRPQVGGSAGPAACDAGAVERAEDGDADLVPDPIDNCPFVANDQTDSGGVGAGSPPDGIGDACQCGDGDDDGAVASSDLSALRAHLVGAVPLAPAGLLKCSVRGSGSDCDAVDQVVLARALAAQAPGVAQVCSAAGL